MTQETSASSDGPGAGVCARRARQAGCAAGEAAFPAESRHLKPYAATPFLGYGYQTWIFPGARRTFALLGLHGQAIFVDPSSRLVMVHTAVRKQPDESYAEPIALWHGLVAALGGVDRSP